MKPERSRSVSALVTALVVVGIAASARASSMEPGGAGDLVTLTTDVAGTQAPCTGVEFPVRTVRHPDATTSELATPAGRVLILTGGSWRSLGQIAANQNFHLTLSLRSGGSAASVFSGAGAFSDAFGEVSGSFDLGMGLALRPGVTLCAQLDNASTGEAPGFVHLQGFFAKEK